MTVNNTPATAEPREDSRRDTWKGRAFGTVSYAAESADVREDLRRPISSDVARDERAEARQGSRNTGERRRAG